MLFGIYCEVQIETLRQIKLKYIEDFDSLVLFLNDIHLLTGDRKPAILAIDSLDCYLENRNLQPLTKQMRLHFLLSLISDAKRFLDQSSTFDANNLIVSYRCAPNLQDSQNNQAESIGLNQSVVSSMPSSEQGQSTANDFSKLYAQFQKYTNQIYYLSRQAVSSQTDKHLLSSSQLEHNELQKVEIYQAQVNEIFFEEDHAWGKKSAQQKLKEIKPQNFKLVPVSSED